MKRAKRIISALLSMVMILAMSCTVFAAASEPVEFTGPFKITIGAAPGETGTTHTYEAYQIFKGRLATEGDTKYLSNVEWGTGISDEAALMTALTAKDEFNGCQSAADVADKLNDAADDAEIAQLFAEIVSEYLSAVKVEGSSPLTVTEAGYYLVKDKDGSLDEQTGAAYTRYVLEVVGDVNVEPKSDVPTVEKKVQDVNDSTGVTSEWKDSADFDLNDDIEYQITGTLPTNYADYETYTYKFTDTMSKGLTLKAESVKVYVVNGETETDITTQAKASAVTADSEGSQTFTVEITDVKALEGVTVNKDSKIVVRYTCTLNENAVTGNSGNDNKVYLEYTNNPNTSSDGTPPTGRTPDDVVVVFTFELKANKVRPEGDSTVALAGAEFTLEKYMAADKAWTPVDSNVTGAGDGKNEFTFKKLDAGIYRLVESKTPDGYNTIDPIYFLVSAEYALDTETGQEKVTSLVIKGVPESAENPDYTAEASYTETISGDTASFSAVFETGEIGTDVLNQRGSVLPSTGGIGTTIFYVIGGILVVGAGILLVTKKRMSAR